MTRLATALDDAEAFIRRYVVITDDQAAAVALWILHTYTLDAADITPYLSITSAEKQSGKTVLLDVLEKLANKPWRAVTPSAAVTFRTIEKECPTLLLDEVDTIWGPKARDEDEGLRALLNAGFRRHGSTVPRCDGPKMRVRNFRTFCPKALAGIGELPDTVADRSIPIRMERKRRDDRVERWRERAARIVAEQVAESIRETGVTVVADLDGYEPELPDELSDRAQDAWEPLLAIADQARGEWPARARAAAVALMASRDDLVPLGSRLLNDIRDIFADHPTVKMGTTELLELLYQIEEAGWSDWYGKPLTARKLASLLKPYGIEPHRERAWRGYFLGDFLDAFSRDLPESVTPVAPVTEVDQ
jgi:uncharacterized protein DUF3631